MPVARWIEDEPGIPAPTSDLAFREGHRVIDDPADRTVGEAGELGIPACPCDGRSSGVHVGQRGTGGPHRERGETRVGEEMQDRGSAGQLVPCLDPVAEPRQHRGMLREEPDLACLGRPQFQGHSLHLDRPGGPGHRLAAPAAITIEPQVRAPPRLGIASRAERHGEWPVRHSLPEPLEPSPTADVEQDVAAVHLRVPDRSGPACTTFGRARDSAGPTAT